MAVRSNLIAVGGSGSSGTHPVYRSPTDVTTIVKQLTIYNDVDDERTFYLDMPLGPDTTWLGQQYVIPARRSVFVDTWIVIPTGWPFNIGVMTAGNWFYWVSGTQLMGVPEHPTQTGPGLVALPSPPSQQLPALVERDVRAS